MLYEIIGKAAMLEQTAEEAAELAQACLKLARYERGENPVYQDAGSAESGSGGGNGGCYVFASTS